jgi:hypothetical protein
MKKIILIMTVINLIACGGIKTFEEKTKVVCDCFDEAGKNKDKRMDCFKKQYDLRETIEGDEKKRSFVETTNSCSDI